MSDVHPPIIAVNLIPAFSGYFATLYCWNYEINFYEPHDTGLGRYATWQEANAEGERWAADLGVEFKPATAEAVEAAKLESQKFGLRMKRIRELRDSGLSLKDASTQARSEGL